MGTRRRDETERHRHRMMSILRFVPSGELKQSLGRGDRLFDAERHLDSVSAKAVGVAEVEDSITDVHVVVVLEILEQPVVKTVEGVALKVVENLTKRVLRQVERGRVGEKIARTARAANGVLRRGSRWRRKTIPLGDDAGVVEVCAEAAARVRIDVDFVVIGVTLVLLQLLASDETI